MLTLAKGVIVLCAAVAASSFELGDADVIFHLFTRTNPTQSQPLLPSINSIMTSSFSLTRKTIVTIHSHGEGVSGNFNAFVVNAHIAAEDVNIIAVDWSPGAGMYSQGLGNAPQAGRVIAQFLNILISQFGYNPNLIRIVGVGLGGHIAGIAARNVIAEIPHIIAIDPSFFGWTHHPEILNPDDAAVVEVLHATTCSSISYDLPLGDVDFYPNGGCIQLGCVDATCSHIYAYAFYAESITQSVNGGEEFVGTACDNYDQATTSPASCEGEQDIVFGGIDVKTDVSGIYTFFANPVSPFARG